MSDTAHEPASTEDSAGWPEEMWAGARRIRDRADVPAELRETIGAHLTYAAGRLARKPAMVGPMTTGALAIALAC
jgi:hypothetical protein